MAVPVAPNIPTPIKDAASGTKHQKVVAPSNVATTGSSPGGGNSGFSS